MKTKTADLTGAELDWAVAHATKAWEWAHKLFPTMTLDPKFVGIQDFAVNGKVRLIPRNPMRQDYKVFCPSADWSQGGPLIDEHHVDLWFRVTDDRKIIRGADVGDGITGFSALGETSLIAAMRCIVASKLGDEVEIPDELLETTP